MTTVLVANRGEIAIRIFRTAKSMGMRTVAVYSDADAGALHARAADEAVHIGPAPASESYLCRDRLVRAALDTGAELVHPGYGFLAEDAQFASEVGEAGLIFVGPPPEVLHLAGDKASARELAASSGVPVLPAASGDEEALRAAAADLGFPLVVKPVGGGGGKGMAVVREAERLGEALDAAHRIAQAAFGDGRLLIERYLDGARHVEVQILADAHGGVIHLGERDCSLQRRHQKVIEESPAPCLAPEVRDALHQAAVTFARAVSYVGAGTCEFLVGPDGSFGFIEMNARLQVEHPVTELVCGIDLVEHQICVARGEHLALAQEDVDLQGHAVEARVYAEDPETGFLPQAGRLLHVRWPQGVRVDRGVADGSDVPAHYDPLLAKVIAHGPNREEALSLLGRALEETEILGVRTNVGFLRDLVADERVADGSPSLSTGLVDEIVASRNAPPLLEERAAAVAAAAEADRIRRRSALRPDPWERLSGWRPVDSGQLTVVLHSGEVEVVLEVEEEGPYLVAGLHIERVDDDDDAWTVGSVRAAAVRTGHAWLVWLDGRQHDLRLGPKPRAGDAAGLSRLDSPLPGRVMAVRVEAGQEVAEGAELVVIEAMKMEHAVVAPAGATVKAVLCSEGEQVDRGQALVELD